MRNVVVGAFFSYERAKTMRLEVEYKFLNEVLLFLGEIYKQVGEMFAEFYLVRHLLAFSRIHSRKLSRGKPSGMTKRCPSSIALLMRVMSKLTSSDEGSCGAGWYSLFMVLAPTG